MGRNDIRRGKSDIAPKRVRIAVLAYPGAQRAAIHGLIDLFETASRLAAGAKPRTTFVATEWAVEDCRGRRGDGLAAIILPPSLDGPISTMDAAPIATRSEEHTSELQSLMRISYAVFCLKKKKIKLSTTQ